MFKKADKIDKTLTEGKTYADLGRDELLKLYKKIKPHTTNAISVLAVLMNSPGISDTTRAKAALSFLQEYRLLVKEIYNNNDMVDPNDETEDQPATIVHLRVVDKKPEPDGDTSE